MADSIKICSLNCQGLGNSKKRRDVFNYLRNLKYSIIFLQDTHFSKDLEKLVQNEWGFKAVFNSLNSRSRGVAIFFNNNFEFKLNKTHTDDSGNILILDILIFDRKITLVNIYGPNKDTPEFYIDLENKLIEFGNNDIIIVGDFNMILNPQIDCINYKHLNNPNARLQVFRLMNDFNLFDVWREENEEEKIVYLEKKKPRRGYSDGEAEFLFNISNFDKFYM